MLVYLVIEEKPPHLFHCFGEIILSFPQPAVSIKLAISWFPQNCFLCSGEVTKVTLHISHF